MRSRLLKTALLGTHRAGGIGADSLPPMQATVQALSNSPDPAAALLQAAAIEHVAMLAGVKSIPAGMPDACEPETKPYVSAAAASAAADLLQADQKLFVAEWIHAAQSRGYVASADWSRRCLTMPIPTHNCGRRSPVLSVFGERGSPGYRETGGGWIVRQGQPLMSRPG